ncbi:hypothetical protein SCOR_29355 [Sulfidibacter corallicola]|uniref:Uncharacterized protein n=1 Tax=Sulfidibacter corallicola TaxID=2818388 RepID=A0A8A4TK72_SULCO|nr:hypothetical protein [Sulfidibacter corallicola]QTD50336.1 hypothetical protein J3U87_32530 [Sulfidibacter corallicola]
MLGFRGFYEGTDNKGVYHRIERRVDPHYDGIGGAAEFPVRYDLASLPKGMSPEDFDRKIVLPQIPESVLERIDAVMVEAEALAEEGRADTPPLDRDGWRRGMILSWIHSRDMTTIQAAMGYPKVLTGRHDLEEFALGKHLKGRLHSADPWYRDYVLGLDDEALINVGFYNAHISASMFKWGDNKSGTQNGMDAHRLSDHHIGTDEYPLDLIEKGVNFVVHHMPREHYGIRHEPKAPWDLLEYRLVHDHSTADSEVLRHIARDAAAIIRMLEDAGKITPWQLLDATLEACPPPAKLENAYLLVRERLSAEIATTSAATEAIEVAATTSCDGAAPRGQGAATIRDLELRALRGMEPPATCAELARAEAVRQGLPLADLWPENLVSSLDALAQLPRAVTAAKARGQSDLATHFERWQRELNLPN